MERDEASGAGNRLLGGSVLRALAGTLGLALLAGLLLRLLFVLHFARITGDALVYGDIARNLLQHHVYGFSQTVDGAAAAARPTLIRLPGYPLFLALCFRGFGMEHYTAVMLVQVAVDLWTCLLLGGVAARIFGRRAGVFSVWLGAVCPFTANYTAAPLTETLTLFCMALAFYALARWREAGAGVSRWVFVLGSALAYAILLRPEQGLLAAAVLPVMLWICLKSEGVERRKAIAPVLLGGLLTIAPLAPWTARNWHTFHVVQPLAPRFANDPGEFNPYGFQRWYRTWAIEFASTEDVYWNYDGATIDPGDLPNRAFDSDAQRNATRALLDDYNHATTATPALDRRFSAIAEQRIHAHALRYFFALPVARVLNMALRPRTEMLQVPLEWWRFASKPAACAFAAAYAGLNLAYFALALAGFRRSFVEGTADALLWSMLATVVLRAALLLTLDNSEARYTLEFFPVLIVLGAGAWPSRQGTRQLRPKK